MCLFIISLLYGRHYFGCGCACGLANDFLDDAALLLLFVCFVFGVSGLHFYGNLTPFYCHTAALATLELSPAVINSATSAILWHAETLIRCQCPMWLPLTILPYSGCPLLLSPLVVVASCCCCWRCYLGFLVPGLSVSVSVWEHNLFALVFAAQETSLLSQADWKSTHPHTLTHS